MAGMTQANDPKPKRRINVLDISWGGFDVLLLIGALLAGFLIWFAPAFWNTPELKAFYKQQEEAKAQRLAVEAEAARVQKENDDLGLVYIQPGTNPFPTEPPKGKTAPRKSGAKPAPKKKDN